MPPVVVKTASVATILRDRGWSVTRLAAEMGMDRTSVETTLAGRQNATPAFQAKLWAVCPRFTWGDLFVDTIGGPPASDESADGEAVA